MVEKDFFEGGEGSCVPFPFPINASASFIFFFLLLLRFDSSFFPLLLHQPFLGFSLRFYSPSLISPLSLFPQSPSPIVTSFLLHISNPFRSDNTCSLSDDSFRSSSSIPINFNCRFRLFHVRVQIPVVLFGIMSMSERKTIDLEQGWDFMQKGITKLKNILEGLPETQFSSEDYMMLYTYSSLNCLFVCLFLVA